MLNFREFVTNVNLSEMFDMDNVSETLNEALITLANGKDSNFGQIVIMAGGAGSGKGFILENLVDIRGKVLDVDALKLAAARIPSIRAILQDAMGKDVDLDSKELYRDPKNTAIAHQVLNDELKLPNKRDNALFASVLTAAPDRKPNIIFDVTLKDLKKLDKIVNDCRTFGYSPKNIHIVWVLTDVEVAMQQNATRARVVPEDIFMETHKGVANTMKDIATMGEKIRNYMDGNIVIAFNGFKLNIDGSKDRDVTAIEKKNAGKNGKSAIYVEKAHYIYLKRAGQSPKSFDELKKEEIAKIASYVPKGTKWNS